MTKILIVEDEKTLCDAYKLILAKEKHQVRTATNGKEALKVLESFEPDIILLDLLMPEMDGTEFLKQYQPKQKHSDVTVVILSNVGDEKKVAQAIELGASRYIVKSHATPAELAQLVKHLMLKL